MSTEDISEADAAPGYETDTDAYYYEDEPRGGKHLKPYINGIYPRNLSTREKHFGRAFYNLRGKSLTDGKKMEIHIKEHWNLVLAHKN